MKRLGFVVIIVATLCNKPTFAVTSGFADNDMCNNTMQFVSCISKYIIVEYEKGVFSDCIISEVEYTAKLQETVHSAAIASCGPKFPGLNSYIFDRVGFFVEPYVASILYDTCIGNTGRVQYANQEAVIALVTTAVGEGFCVCKKGYYVQPRNLEFGEWGTRSECKVCPDGGTTDDEYAIGLARCYLPAGNFSDTVGSGVYTGNCYNNATMEETLAAMQ